MSAALRQNLGLLVLRLSVGILMFLHGVYYVRYGIDMVVEPVVQNGLPKAFAYLIFLGELIAPAFMIVGVYTRLAGLMVATTMAFSVILAHRDLIFTLNEMGAWPVELNGLYCFGALAVALLGSGKFALKPS